MEPQLSKKDLDIYLAYIEKGKLRYKTEARGTGENDKTLKDLDDMAVYAMSRTNLNK